MISHSVSQLPVCFSMQAFAQVRVCAWAALELQIQLSFKDQLIMAAFSYAWPPRAVPVLLRHLAELGQAHDWCSTTLARKESFCRDWRGFLAMVPMVLSIIALLAPQEDKGYFKSLA